MAKKEISVLQAQIEKLNDKKFDLEGWKNYTIILLERIFGRNNSKSNMIRDLKYDFSSWSLRDTSGGGKTRDHVKIQAREILDAAIYELENLGLPEEGKQEERILGLLEDELTGKQFKELLHLLGTEEPGRAEKIKNILGTIEKENIENIIVKLIIPGTTQE